MKKILAILLTLVMLLSLVACAAGTTETTPQPDAAAEQTPAETEQAPAETAQTEQTADEPIELEFWSWLPTSAQYDALIGEFEEENPNIKINYTRTEQVDFFEKLQVAMASGTGPDLYGMPIGSMMEQYAKFSADMKQTADEYWSGWENDINAGAVEQCIAEDGTMVGMPILTVGMTTLLYNKTLMDECGIEKVPTNYEELKDAAEKAKANGYVCVAAGAADDWINSDWFIQISNEFEQGAVYEAAKGERKWTDQCFVDTMTAWQKLFTDGIFEDGALGVATYPDARDQYFYPRKAVFFMTGSWHLGPTSPSNEERQGTEVSNKGDVLGMAPFPSMSDSGVQVATSAVDLLICINKDCEKKEAAMKFIEYMSNGGGQQYLIDYPQGSPVSNNITYAGVVDGELQQESIDTINEFVANAVGPRKLSSSEITTALGVAMQNVAAGADPLTELQEVQNIADSLE